MIRIMIALLVAALVVLAPDRASAFITGGTGNDPLFDPGWPEGAAVIFNQPGRIAWWNVQGCDWHADCRGDAKALSAVLADFAKMDAKTKRVVVHDGIGYSTYLAMGAEPDKLEGAKIDWQFMVWHPKSWQRMREWPSRFGRLPPGETEPPSRIDVYTAGIRWSDVVVPAEIKVVDERLAARGFSADDGAVIEGRVTDLATGQPIAATMRLQRIEQRDDGRDYSLIAEAKADADGRWVLKNVPAGAVVPRRGREVFRLAVEADGFVPRVAGYGQFDGQARWKSYDTALAHPAPVSGLIVDGSGNPLADVEVRFQDVEPAAGGTYDLTNRRFYTTDAEGRFHAEDFPPGKATIGLRKTGYYTPEPVPPFTTPKANLKLHMLRAGSIHVTVDFTGREPPKEYMLELAPEGGNAVGTSVGIYFISKKHQAAFEDVRPGRYLLTGHPNGSGPAHVTEPITIELKAGQAEELTLIAK